MVIPSMYSRIIHIPAAYLSLACSEVHRVGRCARGGASGTALNP